MFASQSNRGFTKGVNVKSGERRSGVRAIARWAIVPAIAFASVFAFALAAPAATPQGQAGLPPSFGAAVGADIGPVAGWLDDLIRDLERVKKALEDSAVAIGGQAGPLGEPLASIVDRNLDSAEFKIRQLQDPGHSPSLEPADAGEVDETVNPTTLSEHAEACADLADEALYEAQLGDASCEVIGTKLKTIQALLPDYRDLAGL
jgi:hypothetical protein